MRRRNADLDLASWLPAVAAATLCAVLLLLEARAARAAEPRDVEALIREGMDLRRQGHDERALPFFQKAYAIQHTPRTAGQLGLAEMANGYWLSAETHLAEALDSPEHPWVSKNQPTLASSLERVRHRIGEVVVSGSPAGARVVVNGEEVGSLPLAAPIRIGEGRVQVEISARDRLPGVKTFHLDGGHKEQVRIDLAAAPVASVAAAKSTMAVPAAPESPASIPEAQTAGDNGGGDVGGGAATATATATTAGTEGRHGRTMAYVAGGLAAASLVLAIVETVRWQQKQSEFGSHVGMPTSVAAQTGCGEADPGRGASGCAGIYDSAKLAWKLSLVGYGVGALLAAGAIYLYVAGSGDQATAPAGQAQSFGCVPRVGTFDPETGVGVGRTGPTSSSAGVTCQLRF